MGGAEDVEEPLPDIVRPLLQEDEGGEEEEAGNERRGSGDDETNEDPRAKVKKRKWLVRADTSGPSQQRTVLYDVWNTTEGDLMDFGPGVALYFKMLRYMMFLLIVAGLISLPNLLYYSSEAYAGPGLDDLPPSLWGSAACADRTWVACPTCPVEFDAATPFFGRRGEDPNKTATATGGDGSTLVFQLKNRCEVDWQQGMVAFACYIFLLVGTVLFQTISERWGKRMDKTVQTADDYTVWVRDSLIFLSLPDVHSLVDHLFLLRNVCKPSRFGDRSATPPKTPGIPTSGNPSSRGSCPTCRAIVWSPARWPSTTAGSCRSS